MFHSVYNSINKEDVITNVGGVVTIVDALLSNTYEEGTLIYSKETKSLYLSEGDVINKVFAGEEHSPIIITEVPQTIKFDLYQSYTTIFKVVDDANFPINYSWDAYYNDDVYNENNLPPFLSFSIWVQ